MIITNTGFGIYLTDEFGEALNGMDEMLEITGDRYEDNEWKFYCPSAEEPQIVFGFECKLDKNTSVQELEEKWQKNLSLAPKEMVEAWENAGKPEPNFVFLAGHC